MLTKENFIEEVNSTINKKSLLDHPFYQKWNEGKLTQEELKEYAKQYYHFVKHFPRFVSCVHSNCDDVKTRQILLENLADEEGYKTFYIYDSNLSEKLLRLRTNGNNSLSFGQHYNP